MQKYANFGIFVNLEEVYHLLLLPLMSMFHMIQIGMVQKKQVLQHMDFSLYILTTHNISRVILPLFLYMVIYLTHKFNT